jgi:hypothetical protein
MRALLGGWGCRVGVCLLLLLHGGLVSSDTDFYKILVRAPEGSSLTDVFGCWYDMV